MPQSIIGARIRERRRTLGLTQADLARRVGISPSYLNLIEHNRRGIAGKRLADVARALELTVSDLDGAAERRLHDALSEIAADPRLAELEIEAGVEGELIGRFPGWARAVVSLARSEEEQGRLLRAFTDRLTHDPFLGESVHRMLTRIAAVRSTAEILESVPDIEADQAARFHAILAEESRTLSDTAEALAAYFDRAATPERSVTPGDELEAIFADNENRFPAIEQALAGVEAQASHHAARAAGELWSGPVIDRLVAEAPQLVTETGRRRARAALADYAADVARAPLASFTETARRHRFDIERIGAETGLPRGLVARRLAALEPGADTPSFGYLRINGAGAILDMRTLRGFHPLRHASLCPLWAVVRALSSPGRVIRQLATLPSGQRLVFVGFAEAVAGEGFGTERDHLGEMVIMTEAHSELTVYGAGIDGQGAEEVGFTCRLCPRKACRHRVEDPIAG